MKGEPRRLTLRVEGVLVCCGTCADWNQATDDEGSCMGPISAGVGAAFGCMWWHLLSDDDRDKRRQGGLHPDHML